MGVSARRVPRVVALPLLLVSASCSGLTGPERPTDTRGVLLPDCAGPATVLDPALAVTLPAADENSSNLNSRWAALAGRVPGGFAGVHFDDGIPVLRLVDVSQAAGAKAALAGVFDERFDMANAEVREARWDYDQLMDWLNYLWLREGITPGGSSGTIWIDVTRNLILYSVEDARQRDRVVRELSALDLPCGLVYIEVVGVFRDS